MENAFLSFTPFDFGIQGGLSPEREEYDKDVTMLDAGEQDDHLFGTEDQLGNQMNTTSSGHDFFQNKAAKSGRVLLSHLSKDQDQQHYLEHQQLQSKPNCRIDNFNFEISSSQHGFYRVDKEGIDHQQEPSKSSSSSAENLSIDFSFLTEQTADTVETNKHMPPPRYSRATLDLLNSYGTAFKNLKGERVSSSSSSSSNIVKGIESDQSYVVNGTQKLSTEEVMRVAGARYVQFSSQGYDDMHHYGYALSGLSEEDTKDVELAHLLLAAAEKVGYQQYERANRLLVQCEWIASLKSNPVQRVVFCFAEALRERIDKETGVVTYKRNEEISQYVQALGTNVAYIAVHQEIPFHQVMQFAGIQAIIENVAKETKIHLLDLEIRSGVQWTGFMEALAARDECPVELLTITAVGVRGKQNIKETGERLESVAKSLNLPFQFKSVILSDMADIKDQLFDEIEDDEALAVYAPIILRTMIVRPRCLENLMRVMRNLSPCVMVVIEVEANHNSPSFVNRFIDTLFFYSAFFDCVDTCVKQEKYRVIMEGLFRGGIQNTVAAEGSQRITRSVKMDVWRAFFAKFRMVEVSFSNSSLYQASLMAKKFSSSTLDMNGKTLVIGWKGTPIHSVSAWRFR